MHGQQKFDVGRALKLRAQGLSNAIIAKRLGVTSGAVYLVFRKYDAEHGPPENARTPQHAYRSYRNGVPYLAEMSHLSSCMEGTSNGSIFFTTGSDGPSTK